MRVLLIKTSSMGDLIHTLPALTDAKKAYPDITFDWLVEEEYTDIPSWHPAVANVYPVALRRWRKSIFSKQTRDEIFALRKKLREQKYDYILDAQGLVKSAWLGLLARGKRVGLDWSSARESLASIFYQQTCSVNFYQHAVVRMRSLFGLALGYKQSGEPEFGLGVIPASNQIPYLVFLHGTTWPSKQWPESYWIRLAELAAQAGYRIKISGASPEEIARAERIGKSSNAVDVMPRLTIKEMAVLLANAKGAVSVDTGFGHLAAAMGVSTVSIYGSTNPDYTGAIGKHSVLLKADFPCSPCLNRECTYKQPSVVKPACYGTVPPDMVWDALTKTIVL